MIIQYLQTLLALPQERDNKSPPLLRSTQILKISCKSIVKSLAIYKA